MNNIPRDSVNATTVDRPAWTAAKAAGDAGEMLVAQMFTALGLDVIRHDERGCDRDLTVSGSVECKVDRLASSTGNLAVETEYRGRPSGISTSTSTSWAFITSNEVLIIRTAQLRRLIDEDDFPTVMAGEGAVVQLVPVDEVRRVARCFKRRGAA